MTMTITEAERATSHHHHHHHHRTSGSELFVCFTSRGSSSSSASMMKLGSSSSSSAKGSILSPGRSDKLREAPASRRLKASGSIRGQSSPMLFATGKKRNGSGFETQEPTSPKVTCIGQVRVKTKQGKKKMRVGRGGEASFSKREHQQHEECLPHRNQRWSHIFCFKKEISFSICEAIREFTCFLPCTSSGDGGGHGERSSASSPALVKDDGKERDGVSTACGAVFAKWLMVLQDGDEKRLREEEPLRGNGRAASAAQAVVVLQDEEEENGGKCTRAEEEMGKQMEVYFKESNKEEKGEEEEEEKIVVPPKNALLLMRCRSDPVRIAALASRFWESPVAARPHEEDEEVDEEDEEEEEEGDYEDVVEERKDDEVEGMLDRMQEEDEVMILEQEEREMDEEEEEVEEDADVFVDLETQEQVESELTEEAHKEREDGEKEIEEEKEEEQEKEKEEDLVVVEEEKGEQNVVIQEMSSEAKEEDGRQLLDKIEPRELLLEERKDKGEETEEEESQGEESPQTNVSPESEDATPITSLEKEEECEDHPLDKEEPRQSTSQREEEEKKETGDSHHAVSLSAHQEEVAADKGGGEEEQEEEDKSLSNKLQLQEFRGDEKKREKKEGRKREAKRGEEKEEGEAPLPDCLLLMMYEPKLSMEVSKETWVCSRDFLWHRPRRQDRKKPQDKGAEEEKTKKQEERETKKRVSFEERPPKNSPSMAKLIEQKLVNAYEPFVLTRCKSEPVRSTSSVSLVPETCFWKSGKLYRPYLGMGF